MTPYTYTAVITRVIDGDTVKADVDLGFNVWRRDQSFRVLGINAREHDEPGGSEAAANLTALLPAGARILLTSVKADKYGNRYDATIELPGGRDLAALLVADGWAAAWNGQGHKPVPVWPRG